MYIIVALIIASLLWWAVTYAITNLPFPGPVKQYGTVIATLVFVVFIVMYILVPLMKGGVNLGF